MGFKISVSLFLVDATSFPSVECYIKTFLDKALLYPIYFFHAYL